MTPIKLLVIDDDELDRRTVARAVKALDAGYEIREARTARQGLALAAAETFDCIFVDYKLPDMDGLDLLVELRTGSQIATPVVMLTGSGNEAIAVEAMKRGAHDYLPKTHLGPEALFRIVANAIEKCGLQKDLAEAHFKIERLALYDSLTGLGNRNLFHIELARAVAIAQRKKTSFDLLLMDLDKFKSANDTFGHAAGDVILAAVGYRLRETGRAADACFRLGGDEFTAILDAGSDGEAAARRIRTAIAEPVPFGIHLLSAEISIGLARFPVHGETVQDLVRAADAAMYADKKSAHAAVITLVSAPLHASQ